MASRALLIPTTLALLMFLVPSAQAGITITVDGPDRAAELAPGETGSVTVNFSFVTNGNIVCPQDSTLTLALNAAQSDSSIGLNGAINPASLSFTIPAGAYTDPSGHHESESQSAELSMSIDAALLPPGHESHTLAATAVYDGSEVGLCQGDIADGNEDTGTLNVNFPITQVDDQGANPGGPATTPAGGGNGGDNMEPDDSDQPTEESPGIGAFVLVLIGLALVALRRRS